MLNIVSLMTVSHWEYYIVFPEGLVLFLLPVKVKVFSCSQIKIVQKQGHLLSILKDLPELL